jgi:hypothetical protein
MNTLPYLDSVRNEENKFYDIDQCYKTFFSPSLALPTNKLECLSLVSTSAQVFLCRAKILPLELKGSFSRLHKLIFELKRFARDKHFGLLVGASMTMENVLLYWHQIYCKN